MAKMSQEDFERYKHTYTQLAANSRLLKLYEHNSEMTEKLLSARRAIRKEQQQILDLYEDKKQ